MELLGILKKFWTLFSRNEGWNDLEQFINFVTYTPICKNKINKQNINFNST